MNIIKKIVEFFKKIGLLRISGHAGTYKSSKDKNYQPSDSLD